MSDIQPFTISIPDSGLADLKQRLSLARFPDELDEAGWDMGAPLADVKRITQHWKDSYDWRKAESDLNALPHFTTAVDVAGFGSINIHFLHQQSAVPNAIPLLFVHGWPGSFLEGTTILRALAAGDGITDPAFHVVVLSLPNFGFSQGVSQRGFAINQYAETAHALMRRLGYEAYVTQGGDWGFYITRALALLYPHACRATHINFDVGGGAPAWAQYPLLALEHALRPYSARETAGLQRTRWFHDEGSGYRAIQATKPQTPGYALADSPVALLAWIYEKLHDWTDDYPWTDDEVCTWVSIYWFSTAGPAASLRIYYEATHPWPNAAAAADARPPVTRARTGEWIPDVPIGYSHQPRELRIVPATWVRKLGPLVFERFNARGGHFFAHETPAQLVADLRDMFRRGSGGAFGVVAGRDGYVHGS